MTDHVGQVLRALREARGYSLRQLANRAKTNDSTLANIEAGRRNLSPAVAKACDKVLGTHVLSMIISEGDPLNRRSLIVSASSLLAAGVIPPGVAAEAVRLGFEAAPGGVDYDAKVAGYVRGLATQPDDVFGATLIADLTALQQIVTTGRASLDQFRAVALLSNIFGLWQGNRAQVADAKGWYGTAIHLADQSEHLDTRVWTRGRAASRALYEGMPVASTQHLARQALALSDQASYGAVEAHCALVHVYALVNNPKLGRSALDGMARVADALPVTEAGPHQRVLLFRAYLEGRVGESLSTAQQAHEAAQPHLQGLPHWRTDSDLYLAIALIRHGDPATGVAHALTAIRRINAPDRVLALGVRDVVQHVPQDFHSDALDELRMYASRDPGPWETING